MGRRSLPWRKDLTILARLPAVERRHLAGEANVTIAAALGVDEKTIRNDLDRLRTLWLERIGDTQDRLRAQIVAELDDARRRALGAAAFDEAAERAVLYGRDADGQRVSVQRDHKGSAQFRGNKAAAIGQARQASMDKAKVLGLIVDKVAPTKGDGSDLTLADLLALARESDDGRDG